MRHLLLPAALVAAALVPADAHAQRDGADDYTAPRNATVDARGARRVEVEAEAGVLRVTGVAGISEVRVRGTARSSHRERVDEIRLVARREGDVVVVRADIPDHSWGDGNRWQALDLVIEVPEGIDVRVEDGSGEATLRGLGALDVRDGSGALEIEDVASARIVDGSGEIELRRVRGEVRLSDGSGAIRMRDVSGSVTIDEDGSGEIVAEGVRGAVVIDRDGSGGIDVRDVGGDFTVGRDGSGGIDYAEVRGAVRVPRRR